MKYICNVLYVWLYDAYKDRSKANSDRDILSKAGAPLKWSRSYVLWQSQIEIEYFQTFEINVVKIIKVPHLQPLLYDS